MNYLKNKSCYLCGPISLDENDGVLWRDKITPKLEEMGVIVRDPCKKTEHGEIGSDKAYFSSLIKERKFKQVKEEFYRVAKSDLRMVDLSDFLIVEYVPSIPTVGTWHEIVVATHIQHKPVLVHCSEENLDKLNPWLLTLIKDFWLFTSWEQMLDYLSIINSGKIDSSHWT